MAPGRWQRRSTCGTCRGDIKAVVQTQPLPPPAAVSADLTNFLHSGGQERGGCSQPWGATRRGGTLAAAQSPGKEPQPWEMGLREDRTSPTPDTPSPTVSPVPGEAAMGLLPGKQWGGGRIVPSASRGARPRSQPISATPAMGRGSRAEHRELLWPGLGGGLRHGWGAAEPCLGLRHSTASPGAPAQSPGASSPSHPSPQPRWAPGWGLCPRGRSRSARKRVLLKTIVRRDFPRPEPACDNRQPLPRGFRSPPRCASLLRCKCGARYNPAGGNGEGARGSPGASLPSRRSEGGIRRGVNPLPPFAGCAAAGPARGSPGALPPARCHAAPQGMPRGGPGPPSRFAPRLWGQQEPGRAHVEGCEMPARPRRGSVTRWKVGEWGPGGRGGGDSVPPHRSPLPAPWVFGHQEGSRSRPGCSEDAVQHFYGIFPALQSMFRHDGGNEFLPAPSPLRRVG